VNAPDAFHRLLRLLAQHRVQYVVIGVAGANYYARSATEVFTTKDRDLFVPPDASNLLSAWHASRESGYDLWSGQEPLGEPPILGSRSASFPTAPGLPRSIPPA